MGFTHVSHIVFYLSICLLGSVLAYDGCKIRYGRRGCYDRVHTGVLVTCDGHSSMSTIPKTIPSDTVYVSLINFNFGTLVRSNFTKFRSVECMNIMDSGISAIEPDTFSDMESLHELELRNTLIDGSHVGFINHPQFRAQLVGVSGSSNINSLDFNGTLHLHKFKVFNLDNNNLFYINPGLVSQMRNLHRLSLSNNQLKSYQWETLTHLEKLNKLYLDGNLFQNIPSLMIGQFSAVKELTLANNPFHCNCRLRWLKEFYEMTADKLLDYPDIRCASPYKSRMEDASIEQFSCSKPEAPELGFYPISATQYALNCTAISDPAPTLTLTFPDGRKLIKPPSEDLSQLENATPYIITESGPVTCHASNSEGESSTEMELDPDVGAYSSATVTISSLLSTVVCILLHRGIPA